MLSNLMGTQDGFTPQASNRTHDHLFKAPEGSTQKGTKMKTINQQPKTIYTFRKGNNKRPKRNLCNLINFQVLVTSLYYPYTITHKEI
jgi:hypothetical protein